MKAASQVGLTLSGLRGTALVAIAVLPLALSTSVAAPAAATASGTHVATVPSERTAAAPHQPGAVAKLAGPRFAGAPGYTGPAPQLSSAPALTVAAATSTCTPPSAPGSVTATAGSNAATVTWSAANGNGAAIVGYVATAYAGAAVAGAVGAGPSDTSASLTDLRGGTAYTVKVVAESSCGYGPAGTSSPVTPTGSTTTYAAQILSHSPLAYYRFSERSAADIAADSSPSAAHGAYNTSVATLAQTGAILNDPDTAVNANSNCCLLATNAPVPTYDTARSLESWVKLSDGNARYLAGWGSNTDSFAAFNVLVAPTSITVVTDSTGNDNLGFGLPYSIQDGNWHYVAVTYDGTTLTAYLDGKSVGSGTFGSELDTQPSALEVGASYNGSSPWYGDLDELALYGSALTAAQIAADFSAAGYAVPGPVTSLRATAQSNAVALSWDAPAPPPTPITGYEITALRSGAAQNAVYVDANAVSWTMAGLAGGASYTMRVQALDAYGRGPAVTSSTVTPSGSTSTYATTVLADKPVAYYRFSEPSGVVSAADSSGYHADGSINPSAATAGQPSGLANDTDSSLYANSNCCPGGAGPALPQYDSPRTLEALVKPSDCNLRWVASWGYGSGLVRQSFDLAASCGEMGLLTGQGQDDHYFGFPRNIEDGNWHHLAITYDGNVTLTGYLDGQPLGTQTLAAPLNTINNTGLEFGAASIGGANPWYGGLDELAVYPRALSAADIANHFAASGYARPGVPNSVTASYGNTNAITVSWGVPGPPGVSISYYRVEAFAGSSGRNALFVPGTATAARITGLAGGTAYTVQVQAFNGYGASPVGTSGSFTPSGSTTTYSSQVLSDGPVAYYRFSDTGSSNLADSSGHDADGSYACCGDGVSEGQSGAILYDPDYAISLNGNCCAATVTSPALPQYNQPRTVEAWVKLADANERMIASWGSGQQATRQSYGVAVAPQYLVVDAYNDGHTFFFSHNIEDGHWHQVTVTYDGTNLVGYLDGQELGSQTFAAPLDTINASGLAIGGRQGFGGSCCYNPWYGGLDELAVYPTALSSTQVATHFSLSQHKRVAAASGLSAVAGANSISLAWSTPSSTNDAPLQGFRVAVTAGGVMRNALYVGATQTSTVISGLPSGVAYTVQITSLNPYGVGGTGTFPAATPSGSSTTYASTVMSHAPVVYYRFSDTQYGYAADSSGHRADGALVYGDSVSQGQSGALLNDPDPAVSAGANCNCPITVTSPVLPQYHTARTVEFWVKPGDSNFRWVAAWGEGSGATRDGFGVGVSTSEVGVITINDDHYFAFPSSIGDGNWHYIAVTYDGNLTITAYLDGTSLGSQTLAAPLNTLNDSGLELGWAPMGGFSSWYGGLDELAVYASALSATQVSADYAASGH